PQSSVLSPQSSVLSPQSSVLSPQSSVLSPPSSVLSPQSHQFPMRIHTILVPYDSGHRTARMGRGPLHFSKHGASNRLRAGGHEVIESVVDVTTTFPTEVGTSFELHRSLADRV